jgi:hypothetical protein
VFDFDGERELVVRVAVFATSGLELGSRETAVGEEVVEGVSTVGPTAECFTDFLVVRSDFR